MKFTGTVPPIDPQNVLKYSNGHWKFDEQMGGKKKVGFIYVIYDTVLNRAYLGKKNYYGKGRLNNGVESNWKTYMSSSPVLKELFKHRPKSEFEFYVVEEYTTQGGLSYAESWSLFFVEAPTTVNFYNTLIEKVSWNVREPISDRHKQRLKELLERLEKCQRSKDF